MPTATIPERLPAVVANEAFVAFVALPTVSEGAEPDNDPPRVIVPVDVIGPPVSVSPFTVPDVLTEVTPEAGGVVARTISVPLDTKIVLVAFGTETPVCPLTFTVTAKPPVVLLKIKYSFLLFGTINIHVPGSSRSTLRHGQRCICDIRNSLSCIPRDGLLNQCA